MRGQKGGAITVGICVKTLEVALDRLWKLGEARYQAVSNLEDGALQLPSLAARFDQRKILRRIFHK